MQNQMESRLFLDVVVGQGPAILKLLAGEDEPLLIRRNSLLVLDLCLDIFDGVRGLHLKGDGLAGEGLDKDLHAASQSKVQVKGGLLLDVVVREGPAILELLASKDQPLLIWRDSLLVLDLGFNILNAVRGLNLEGDGLASQGLDENLHASSESEHKMEGGLLLDVVVREGPPILELLSSKDEPLLIWGDSLLVLDLGFNILNAVRGLNLKGDGLASQGLDKDLHASSQSEHKMEGGLLLDVVVREGPPILELLSSKDEPLLVW